MIIGDRVLTADEFEVAYTENENLVITGGQAKNLKIISENGQTVTEFICQCYF